MNWSRVNMPDGTYEVIARKRTMHQARRIAKAKGLKYADVPGYGWCVLQPAMLGKTTAETGDQP